MIHYTLLPEKEIRTLKREYRTRLLIILIFFVSIAVMTGIVSLVPAYIFSSLQAKEATTNLQSIKNSVEKTNFENVVKELTTTNEIAKKIKNNESPVISSDIIGRIISSRTPGIQINSFSFTTSQDTSVKNSTTTITQVVIQGKGVSREAVVNFKENLVVNPLFTKVELPVSDLTKNKDIPFSIRLTIISKK